MVGDDSPPMLAVAFVAVHGFRARMLLVASAAVSFVAITLPAAESILSKRLTTYTRPIAASQAVATGPICAFGTPLEGPWNDGVDTSTIPGTKGVIVRRLADRDAVGP